jgi:hypothetical protein
MGMGASLRDSKASSGAPGLNLKQSAADLLILALVWGAAVLIVNPAGNFPLNDDWSYGLAVKRLLAEHTFRPTGWTAMPLFTNVVWGALFCSPRGFSFEALRASTLSIALLGVAATYIFMRSLRQPRGLAILAAIIVGLNPLYFALSNTFMTDVPFTAIALVSAYFLACNLRSDSTSSLVAGTLTAIAACLSRQLGIAIPMAFAVTLFLTRGFGRRNFARASLPFAACLAALLEFHHALSSAHRLPALYDAATERFIHGLQHPIALAPMFVSQARASLLYLGLFLLPIAIFPAWSALRSRSGRRLFVGALLLLAVLSGISARHGHPFLMPVLDNVLAASGIGPVTLGKEILPPLPRSFWILVTGLSFFGAALLVAILTLGAARVLVCLREGKRLDDAQTPGIFLLTLAAIYLAPLLMTEVLDRYLIPMIPLLLMAVMALSLPLTRAEDAFPRSLKICACVFAIVMAGFSTCSTHDYLAWNRARWQALGDLTGGTNVNAEEIDGGFEFRELHAYAADDRLAETDVPDEHGQETYWVNFDREPGYTVVIEYGYSNWLPPRREKLFVLKRSGKGLPVD